MNIKQTLCKSRVGWYILHQQAYDVVLTSIYSGPVYATQECNFFKNEKNKIMSLSVRNSICWIHRVHKIFADNFQWIQPSFLFNIPSINRYHITITNLNVWVENLHEKNKYKVHCYLFWKILQNFFFKLNVIFFFLKKNLF